MGIAAVTGLTEGETPSGGGALFDEADWNHISTLESDPYRLSKTKAEQAAWRLQHHLGFEMVTILPSFVVGPPSSATMSGATSVKFMKGWLDSGANGVAPPNSPTLPMVDVRDVALAHIRAAESSD